MATERIDPKELKAFTQMDFTRDEFETWVAEDKSVKVTDEQWEKIVELLDSKISGFVDEVVYEIVVDFREGWFNDKKIGE